MVSEELKLARDGFMVAQASLIVAIEIARYDNYDEKEVLKALARTERIVEIALHRIERVKSALLGL